MRIGSLFSGYAGLDAGVQQVIGGTVAWHSDIEPASVRLLEHHYPDVPNLGDITTVDWAAVEPVDVLTAGYPCQPFSAAGLRKGADDERYLWPHVATAISRLGPRLVVLENVAGHLVRGFSDVVGSLASLGYDAQWATVRASDVGAPHRRERLFVAAWPAENSYRATGGERRFAAPGQAEVGRSRPDAGRRDRALITDTPGAERGTEESEHLAQTRWGAAELGERAGTPADACWGTVSSPPRPAAALRRLLAAELVAA